MQVPRMEHGEHVVEYATYFDRHFLSRGVALYHSLARHSPPFRLWVLCLDDETFWTLSRLCLEHTVLVPLAELERSDQELARVKPTRQELEYYWTCGPAFLVHVLEQSLAETVVYLDADLFFFGDPTPIQEQLAASSVLLVEHRWSRSIPAGDLYNVGLVGFRRTPEGVACLRRWREQCLEWCFDRKEDGRFGDQTYLDEWPARYNGVTVLEHRGAGLSLWNIESLRFRWEQGRILVDDDPLVYYHFSKFRIVTNWLYELGLWRWKLGLDPFVKRHLYLPYAQEVRAARKQIRAVGGWLDPVDTVRTAAPSRSRLLWYMLRYRSFLVVTDAFAL